MMNISVEDSGVGMSKEQISRLFTPFTKIKSNRELNKEGVGLGLAVSKNIAKALGGDITVVSEIGQGSKFTLTLPYNVGSVNNSISNYLIQKQEEASFESQNYNL